jgi:uncharacterized membrane protein YeaQ/YmgE (transglycosylase-associated protein family)
VGIIGFILLGLIAGAIAKAIMPGDDPGGIIVTTLIGIAGAVVGGLIASALDIGSRRVLRHRYLADRHRGFAAAAVCVSPDRRQDRLGPAHTPTQRLKALDPRHEGRTR